MFVYLSRPKVAILSGLSSGRPACLSSSSGQSHWRYTMRECEPLSCEMLNRRLIVCRDKNFGANLALFSSTYPHMSIGCHRLLPKVYVEIAYGLDLS
jgi:hypothetical protein